MMAGALRMRDDQLALILMLGGLGCVVAWIVCRSVVAIWTYRLERASDLIKLHVVKGGRLPDRDRLTLAREYLHLRWLGIVGNILLFSGVLVMLLAQVIIF
jgi:hypothetical protein